MINRIQLYNFGPIEFLSWDKLGPINLIIGENGTGKTFILKALYTAIKTIEEFQRGNDKRTVPQILSEKLYWTFQPEKLGDIVTKGTNGSLRCKVYVNKNNFSYSFGKDTTTQITRYKNSAGTRDCNSIFLPAKEVLSLYKIIRKSREQDKVFGFDDTYLDLVRALEGDTTQGKNYGAFAQSRENLKEIVDGRIEFDKSSGDWQFKKGKQKFPIGVTAEGIKKIAILDRLLGNRYLSPNSIVFIDEPESALHPVAISKLLDIIALLADKKAGCGIQFFLSSHSYFVVKKLFLIAQQKNMSIPILALKEDEYTSSDLLEDGIPDNAIIDESIRLYEEEVDMVL